MIAEASRIYDVFLSYSSKDKTWADAACAVLERHRIRCWIAPRDTTPGGMGPRNHQRAECEPDYGADIFGARQRLGEVRREVEAARSA